MRPQGPPELDPPEMLAGRYGDPGVGGTCTWSAPASPMTRVAVLAPPLATTD